MNEKTRKLTLSAMLSAMAYLLMLVLKFSVVAAAPYLKYDPKDVAIAIGGFLLGPVQSILISVLVSLLEMFTASESGIIGFFMNVLSTVAFVLPAAMLYRRHRTIRSAVVGLGIGVVAMTAMMLAWNYIITPMYTGMPRDAIAAMLLPVFLPFNLLKGLLNAGVTLLVYKPVVQALGKAHMLPPAKSGHPARRFNPTVTLIAVFTVATAIACFWLMARG